MGLSGWVDLGLTFMFDLSLIWRKMLMLELGLPYLAMVPLSLIAIFWPFWQCCKKVYPFNCHVVNMSTQSDAVVTKSNRPLYHIDKKSRPYSTLTGKMGRPNSNIAKMCFWGVDIRIPS